MYVGISVCIIVDISVCWADICLGIHSRSWTWKWSFIVDISACVIVDGLINPTALAWLSSLINPTVYWLDWLQPDKPNCILAWMDGLNVPDIYKRIL